MRNAESSERQRTTDDRQRTKNGLRFAFRPWLKNPGPTAVAGITLALGIGANTALHEVLAPMQRVPAAARRKHCQRLDGTGVALQTVYSFKFDSARNATTLVGCDARGQH